MDIITLIVVVFSMIAAFDRMIGGKLGLSEQFERGFKLLGTMSLSMIGMIVISPFIAELLAPCFSFIYTTFGLDPSIIPASLFANDMGGAPLAKQVAIDNNIGMYNALVVSSMMGCTISFTIPYALTTVRKDMHKPLLLGLLCGIVTIPVGCFFAGLISKIPLAALIINLLPLIIISVIIAVGLLLAPDLCVKIFGAFGTFMKILITFGLALGILKKLAGIELIKGLETIEYGAEVCFNASIVMSGAFPFIHVLSKLLAKPISKIGERAGINRSSAIGFVSSLATNVTTFELMNRMDNKGAMLNSAFAVSAAFTFAGHLAFTMSFDASYIPEMIIGKLISGIFAVILAALLYKKTASAMPENNF